MGAWGNCSQAALITSNALALRKARRNLLLSARARRNALHLLKMMDQENTEARIKKTSTASGTGLERLRELQIVGAPGAVVRASRKVAGNNHSDIPFYDATGGCKVEC